MSARRQFTQRLSIVIVAVFLTVTVIALAFATQPVDAKPGNGNPNPHKYTPTPTPDYNAQTSTARAGATQTWWANYTVTFADIQTQQPTWTAMALTALYAHTQTQQASDFQTAMAGTSVGYTATSVYETQQAAGTLTAQAPTPEP